MMLQCDRCFQTTALSHSWVTSTDPKDETSSGIILLARVWPLEDNSDFYLRTAKSHIGSKIFQLFQICSNFLVRKYWLQELLWHLLLVFPAVHFDLLYDKFFFEAWWYSFELILFQFLLDHFLRLLRSSLHRSNLILRHFCASDTL